MEPLKNIDEMLVKLGEGVPPRTMSYKQALSLSAEYGGEDIDQAKAKIKNIEKAFNELEAQRVRLDHEETELQNEYEQVQAEFIEIMQDIKNDVDAEKDGITEALKSDIDALVKAFGLYKYAGENTKDIKVQQRLYDAYQRVLDRLQSKYPDVDLTSSGFQAELDRKSKAWLQSRTSGPGVDW